MSTSITYTDGAATVVIAFDAVTSETHSGAVTVTDHSVEEGAAISDHVRPLAETLTVSAFVSNTPLSSPSSPLTRQTSGLLVFDSRSSGDGARSGDVYAQLRALKDGGYLATVETDLRTYENMVLTDLSVPRDSKTGNGLACNLTFKSIRFVRTQRVTVRTTEDKTKTKKATGKKAVEQKEPEQSESVLRQLVAKAFSLF